jgi:hypothetical protein
VDTDLLFIDTWHVYGHLKRELAYWHSYAKKFIILHDTTVDEIYGETIRMRQNPVEQSAGGLFKLISTLTLAQSGRFWTWDGREHIW